MKAILIGAIVVFGVVVQGDIMQNEGWIGATVVNLFVCALLMGAIK